MKSNIILAGVGGQGILTIAYVMDNVVLDMGWNVKQSEVHGMSQRGGAVSTHIRISDQEIYSDLIPKGEADIVMGIEPVETMRYLDYLKPDGGIITNTIPEINIPNYPDVQAVLERLRNVEPHVIIDAAVLAKEAGSAKTQNIVLVGALSKHLDVPEELYRKHITELFSRKGEKIVNANLRAFELGRQAESA